MENQVAVASARVAEIVAEAERAAANRVEAAENEAFEILANAQEQADRIVREAQTRADEIRDAARQDAREIVGEASATAREVLRDGTELSGHLRELSDSLRSNAELLLRDVRVAHDEMSARVEQIVPDADAGARERGSAITSDLYVPEF